MGSQMYSAESLKELILKHFCITYSHVKKRVHSLSIHSFCIRSLKKTKSGPWQILKLGQYNLHIIQCHNLFKHKFRQNTEAVFEKLSTPLLLL